jgi:predicted metalloprotease with PDZ domain
MKKLVLSIALFGLFIGCKSASNVVSTTNVEAKKSNNVTVFIDLNKVEKDRILVEIQNPKLYANEVNYQLPKTVPGTYSIDNYGKLMEDFKAFDAKGAILTTVKLDENTYQILNAKALAKVTYFVNDTFDTEKGGGFGQEDIFSPAGTNIAEGKNFVINYHGFIGFFSDNKDVRYSVKINHPENLIGYSSLIDADTSATSDLFEVSRYNDLVDNPIMYSKPDSVTFKVDDMDILFAVYSPNGKHTAKDLSAGLETMMRAQKTFLGAVNGNKKYTVLLYLSEMQKRDAKGFGALEHNTSTTVVFPEIMPKSVLGKQLIDVVSHEFFHIVTPLGVHSNEIHYFDFNDPKMSKHLWMYEGVTEYFANLFQVNQGLITEDAFYKRMLEKIKNAKAMNDSVPFTVMSENVLKQPYKDQYLNVYEKGALIGMCIDIIIREKSDGKKGILNLMQALTNEFGPTKPFTDDELFDKITSLTYPEVGEFLKTHVSGETPINYDVFFAKVGVGMAKTSKAINPFVMDRKPLITADPTTKEIKIINDKNLSQPLAKIGFQANDIIKSIDGVGYNLDKIGEMMFAVQQWQPNQDVTITIVRDGKEKVLKSKSNLEFEEIDSFQLTDKTKESLNKSWLKG